MSESTPNNRGFARISGSVRLGLLLAAVFCLSYANLTLPAAAADDPMTASLLQQAKEALAAKQYLNAMIHADKAIAAHPESQMAHFYRGLSLHYLKNLKGARTEYEFAAQGANSEVAKRAGAALAALPGGSSASVKPAAGPHKRGPAVAKGANPSPSTPGLTTPAVFRPTLLMFLSDDATSIELGPVLVELDQKYKAKVRIERIRVDDAKNRSELEKYNIQDAPIALFLDKDGRIVDRMEDFSDCRWTFADKLDSLLK